MISINQLNYKVLEESHAAESLGVCIKIGARHAGLDKRINLLRSPQRQTR